jgi:hypothetical protein
MELQAMPFRTPAALGVPVTAPTAVPRVYDTPNRRRDVTCRRLRGRDVTRRRLRGLVRDRAPRPVSLGDAPGFDALQLLGDRGLDDGGQIRPRSLPTRGHQRLKALQLVLEVGPDGELDLVPAGSQRLEGRARSAPGSGGGHGPRGTQIWLAANCVWTQFGTDLAAGLFRARHLGA